MEKQSSTATASDATHIVRHRPVTVEFAIAAYVDGITTVQFLEDALDTRINVGSFFMIFSLPLFWIILLVLSTFTVVSNENGNSNWYDNLTLCCCVLAFPGAVFVPLLMSCCCRCLDRAHTDGTRNTAGPTWFQDNPSTSNASYPRQPASSEKDDTKRQSIEGRSNNNTTDVEINFLTY